MNTTIRNAVIASALSVLFAGSVFAEEAVTPRVSQERVEQKAQQQERLQLRLNEQAVEAERATAREQVRSEEQAQHQEGTGQKTQAQERLQKRLNEQDGAGEQSKARNEHRGQHSSERGAGQRQMQSRPMGR